MSTRSVVAIPQGDGWKGRYVHSDGYPEHMLPTLLDLVNRKGLDRTIDVLINWNGGWSFIGNTEGVTNYLPTRAHFVSDYGLAYSRKESPMDSWYTDQSGDPLFIDFVYILGPKSITVLESYQELPSKDFAHRLLKTTSYDSLIGV